MTTLLDRCRANIAHDEAGCWIWQGVRDRKGYGRIKVTGRTTPAHRAVWELLCDEIPAGMTLDHTCRNPACVNPDHMEVVSAAENSRRGRAAAPKTHCPQGHPYDEKNTLVWADGKRRCRVCQRAHSRRSYKKWVQTHLLERAAYQREWRAKNPERIAEYNRRRRKASRQTPD